MLTEREINDEIDRWIDTLYKEREALVNSLTTYLGALSAGDTRNLSKKQLELNSLFQTMLYTGTYITALREVRDGIPLARGEEENGTNQPECV